MVGSASQRVSTVRRVVLNFVESRNLKIINARSAAKSTVEISTISVQSTAENAGIKVLNRNRSSRANFASKMGVEHSFRVPSQAPF